MWSLATKVLRFDTKKALNKFFIKKSLRYCTTFKVQEINMIKVKLENALLQYSGAVRIPSEEVAKEFFKIVSAEDQMKSSFVTEIFKSCEALKMPELSLSCYKFLKSENFKFTDIHYYIILQTISRSQSFKKEKDNLIELYNDLKPLLHGYNYILIDVAAAVFCDVQDFWNELKNIPGFQESKIAATFLIAGAFNFNFPEFGWNLLKEKLFLTPTIVSSYINYCIALAQNNKFSVEVLNDFIEFCKENILMLSRDFPVEQTKVLIEVLNSKKNAYFWSIKETTLSNCGHCLHCNSKLLDVGINEEELQVLRQHVLNDVFINKNINIKTSEKEIQQFFKFLEKNQDIDIVVDGLNMYYFMQGVPRSLKIIKMLQKKGLRILIILKKHSKIFKYFNVFKDYCKVYVADILSDDDIFLIYAAMHIGLKTNILTCDLLRGYGHLLKNEHLRKLFNRWQFTHQYRIKKYPLKIIPPPSHSLSPQITEMNEQNYCCHIPIKLNNFNFATLKSFSPHWLCIRRRTRHKWKK